MSTDNTDAGITNVDSGTSVDGTFGSGPAIQPNIPILNPMKATLELETYNFSNPRRGHCIIINNHHFNSMLTGQTDRTGTDIDAKEAESLFMSLGFEVTRHDDLKVNDMSMELRKVSMADHSDADCFACVLLSHGDNGVIYGTNGTLKLDEIIAMFKGDSCPTLAGKPKLFFIQACRGRRYDHGVEVADGIDVPDAAKRSAIDETDACIRRIPVEADILLTYSVVPGYFSWRNNVDGSWFVQGLVRVLREHWDRLEMLQMLTLVNKVVAYDFESCTDSDFTCGMKQVPCFVSTLTKLLYFKPKY